MGDSMLGLGSFVIYCFHLIVRAEGAGDLRVSHLGVREISG